MHLTGSMYVYLHQLGPVETDGFPVFATETCSISIAPQAFATFPQTTGTVVFPLPWWKALVMSKHHSWFDSTFCRNTIIGEQVQRGNQYPFELRFGQADQGVRGDVEYSNDSSTHCWISIGSHLKYLAKITIGTLCSRTRSRDSISIHTISCSSVTTGWTSPGTPQIWKDPPRDGDDATPV